VQLRVKQQKTKRFRSLQKPKLLFSQPKNLPLNLKLHRLRSLHQTLLPRNIQQRRVLCLQQSTRLPHHLHQH